MSSYDNFNGSNAIRIILRTEVDFTAETPDGVEILYEKPDGTTGIWAATILAGSESDGKIYYDMTPAESLDAGVWWVRAKITYSDTRVLYTEKVSIKVGD